MNCEQLDDYLCRRLDDADVATFEDHASECQGCRVAISEDRELLRLLKTASERLEKTSATLTVSRAVLAGKTLPESTAPERRLSGLAVGTSIAAVLLLAVAIHSRPTRQPKRPVTDSPTAIVTIADPVPRPTVRLSPGFSKMAIESYDPDIKIFMVFADTTAADKSVEP